MCPWTETVSSLQQPEALCSMSSPLFLSLLPVTLHLSCPSNEAIKRPKKEHTGNVNVFINCAAACCYRAGLVRQSVHKMMNFKHRKPSVRTCRGLSENSWKLEVTRTDAGLAHNWPQRHCVQLSFHFNWTINITTLPSWSSHDTVLSAPHYSPLADCRAPVKFTPVSQIIRRAVNKLTVRTDPPDHFIWRWHSQWVDPWCC